MDGELQTMGQAGRRTGSFLLGLLAMILSAEAAEGAFFVADLGRLPGSQGTDGTGINVFGHIAGTATIDDFHSLAVSGGGSSVTSLGTLPGGTSSSASGINATGQIAGTSDILITNPDGSTSHPTHAFRSTGGALEDLGTFTGDIASEAFGINAGGHIAGASFRANGTPRAVIGFGKDNFKDLGDLGGGSAVARAINGNDQATGWALLPSFDAHAFRWSTNNGMRDLGTLSGFSTSEGRGINQAGEVAGFSGSFGASRAFLASGINPLRDLGVLPFSTSSEALGLNDSTQIVGQADFGSGPSHAFVWDPQTGIMHDLNDLLAAAGNITIISAAGINNATQIVGSALVGNEIHAVILTPNATPFLPIGTVPEPGSWLLLAIGGGLAAVGRLRRERKAALAGDERAVASPGR